MTSIGASRVLVAGASGFIGGTLTRRLAAQGVRVRAGVKSTSSTLGLALPGVEIVLAERDRAMGEGFTCAADAVRTWRQFRSGYAALAGHSRWLAMPIGPLRANTRMPSLLAPAGTPAAEISSLVGFLTGRRRFRVDKAADLPDWRPRVGLEEGLASCVPYRRQLGLFGTGDGRAAWPAG